MRRRPPRVAAASRGVLLTHSHADHSAGAPVLDAPLLFGDVGTGDEASGEAGVEPGSRDIAVAVEPERVGPFEALPTPGHATDHVCFLLGEVGFCGDLVLGHGSSFVPPDGGSLAAYLDSLERLRAADLKLLCPGHGPYIADPADRIDEYIEHRLMRERRLVAALDEGERSRAAPAGDRLGRRAGRDAHRGGDRDAGPPREARGGRAPARRHLGLTRPPQVGVDARESRAAQASDSGDRTRARD